MPKVTDELKSQILKEFDYDDDKMATKIAVLRNVVFTLVEEVNELQSRLIECQKQLCE